MQQLHGPRHETPLSRLYSEFMRRRAPPTYHEAMLTSRPYEEVRREYLEQLDQSGQRSNSRRRNSRRSSRGRQHNQAVNTDQMPPCANSENTISCESETANNSNHSQNSTHSSTLLERQSSRSALIQNDSESNDSSESELETPSRDRVRVSFTSDTGVSAQFP